jgi:hypothetical protein
MLIKRMKLKNYHQADLVGPGVWYALHLLAYDVSNGSIKRSHMDSLIVHIRTHFPCLECRGHFKTMTDENPMFEVTTDKVFEKIFQYHSKVNNRLDKTGPIYRDVEEWFDSDVPMLAMYFPIKRIGLGLWWLLHSTAAHNVTLFETILKLLQSKLLHSESRATLGTFNSSSREAYPTTVWEMHDTVNRQMQYDASPELRDTLKFFASDEGCKEGCTAASSSRMIGRYVAGRR